VKSASCQLDEKRPSRTSGATVYVLVNGAAFTNRVLSVRRLEDKRSRTFSHDEKSPSHSLTPYFNGSPDYNS